VTLSQFYTRVSYALRGTDEDTPEHGDDEAVYWLDALNRKKDELYEDTSQNWRTTYKETAPNEPGTVATTATTALTGTSTNFSDYRVGDKITVSGETERTIATIPSDTSLTVTVAFANTASDKTFTHKNIIATGIEQYSAHRSFLNPNTNAYVTTTSDQRVDLEIISPEERSVNKQQLFLSDENPQLINFTVDIESTDSIVDGTLVLPGHYMPDDVSATTDILPFLDPNWAVMAVAAEIAFNDITYEDKAPDLNAKANALYRQMVKRNRALVYGQPRKTPYNVKRIGFRSS